MAKLQVTTLVDDLTGEEITSGGETLRFALDERHYEVDLTEEHARQFRAGLDEYLRRARRVGRATGIAKPRVQLEASAAEIKAWARSNGYKVSDRGRIPLAVREAFGDSR